MFEGIDVLEESIRKRALCTVASHAGKRRLDDEKGFPYYLGSHWLFMNDVGVAHLDGHILLSRKCIDQVTCDKADSAFRSILYKEGLLKGLKERLPVNMEGLSDPLKDIASLQYTVGMEINNGRDWNRFEVGQILAVTIRHVVLRTISVGGIWREDDLKVPITAIASIVVDGEYTRFLLRHARHLRKRV